jgi:hypothetical protein
MPRGNQAGSAIPNKDLRALARKLAKLGWTVEKSAGPGTTGGGHLRWTAPDGEVFITPSTTSVGVHTSVKKLRAKQARLERDDAGNQDSASPSG